MLPFTYQYNGESFDSQAIYYQEDGYRRFRVVVPDGREFIIAPAGIPGKNGAVIWGQPVKPGEENLAHELVQAMGEGVEKAGGLTLETPSFTFFRNYPDDKLK